MPKTARTCNCCLIAFNRLILCRGLSSPQTAHPVSLMFCDFILLQACSIMDVLRFLLSGAGGNSMLEGPSNLGSGAFEMVSYFALECLCHLSVGILGFVGLLINTVLLCRQQRLS